MLKTTFILFLLFLSLYLKAENTFNLEVYGSSLFQEVNKDSPFNKNNTVLNTPIWTHTLEVRPDIELNFFDSHSLVLRSRHFNEEYKINYSNPKSVKYDRKDDSDLSDLFISSSWGASFSTTIGLQNYQWGPAEIFSPSNPFFHFQNDQRSFFYKEKGRELVRFNWNPDAESKWSVVGMYEPENNRTAFWTADQEFKPRSALKIERQFENPANALAIIMGQSDLEKSFLGEYLTWSPDEGLSFYMDAKHQKGRNNFRPEKNVFNLYDFVAPDEKENRVFTLAVVGFRWEGRVDFRQEFVYNEAGFNKKEWDQARSAALTLSTNLLTNLRRFTSPGLEFRTKAYSYTSIRIPDLGATKMASVSARWFSSLIIDSSALQMNYDYNWNDHTVVSAELNFFYGSSGSEFRIINDKQGAVGFRWSY